MKKAESGGGAARPPAGWRAQDLETIGARLGRRARDALRLDAVELAGEADAFMLLLDSFWSHVSYYNSDDFAKLQGDALLFVDILRERFAKYSAEMQAVAETFSRRLLDGGEAAARGGTAVSA